MHKTSDTETSGQIRDRVNRAHIIQEDRFRNDEKLFSNARMGIRDIDNYCEIDHKSKQLLSQSVQQLQLSARAYHKILKIGRTIADLDGAERITLKHVAEAVQYRRHEIN